MKFRFYALKLCVVLFLVFLIQIFFSGFTEIFVLNKDAWRELWRFFSSIFLHGGFAHLLYNCFALALFGTILESLIGARKFLFVFFFTGILANLVSVNFYSSSLGASGAIFGIIGTLIIIRPMLVVWAFGLPMPIFVAGILWAGGDLIGAVGFLSGNPLGNTGNIAHLFGVLFGLLLGALWRKRYKKRLSKDNFKLRLDEDSMRRWEDGYLR